MRNCVSFLSPHMPTLTEGALDMSMHRMHVDLTRTRQDPWCPNDHSHDLVGTARGNTSKSTHTSDRTRSTASSSGSVNTDMGAPNSIIAFPTAYIQWHGRPSGKTFATHTASRHRNSHGRVRGHVPSQNANATRTVRGAFFSVFPSFDAIRKRCLWILSSEDTP